MFTGKRFSVMHLVQKLQIITEKNEQQMKMETRNNQFYTRRNDQDEVNLIRFCFLRFL